MGNDLGREGDDAGVLHEAAHRAGRPVRATSAPGASGVGTAMISNYTVVQYLPPPPSADRINLPIIPRAEPSVNVSGGRERRGCVLLPWQTYPPISARA